MDVFWLLFCVPPLVSAWGYSCFKLAIAFWSTEPAYEDWKHSSGVAFPVVFSLPLKIRDALRLVFGFMNEYLSLKYWESLLVLPNDDSSLWCEMKIFPSYSGRIGSEARVQSQISLFLLVFSCSSLDSIDPVFSEVLVI